MINQFLIKLCGFEKSLNKEEQNNKMYKDKIFKNIGQILSWNKQNNSN